jgi:uncharacterized protein (DUF488 family)
VQLYTIGFTQKTAQQFFTLLQTHHVQVLADTRLKPDSQLSGFAKGRDLPYLLEKTIGCVYQPFPQMAPSADILDQYRKDKDWGTYAIAFTQLLADRDLIAQLDPQWWQSRRVCLLCSEHEPDQCHRRLVAEYISQQWTGVEIIHLM